MVVIRKVRSHVFKKTAELPQPPTKAIVGFILSLVALMIVAAFTFQANWRRASQKKSVDIFKMIKTEFSGISVPKFK